MAQFENVEEQSKRGKAEGENGNRKVHNWSFPLALLASGRVKNGSFASSCQVRLVLFLLWPKKTTSLARSRQVKGGSLPCSRKIWPVCSLCSRWTGCHLSRQVGDVPFSGPCQMECPSLYRLFFSHSSFSSSCQVRFGSFSFWRPLILVSLKEPF